MTDETPEFPSAKAEFRAGLPRLILWKHDVAEMLGVGIRTLERMISCREMLAPNCRLRGRPAWTTETIRDWVAKGCLSVKTPA